MTTPPFFSKLTKKHSRFIYVLGLCVLLLILFRVTYLIDFILYDILDMPYGSLATYIVEIALHAAAFLAVIAVGLRDQKMTLASVCFFKKVSRKVWGAAILCTIGCVLFNFYMHDLFYSFLYGWDPGLGEPGGDFIFNVINTALIPAVAEELLFKGLIFSILKKRHSLIVAVIIASLMFAAVHLSLIRIIPLFLSSCFTFWIYLRSGSIILPMFEHFINNLFTFVLISEPFANLGTFYAALLLFTAGSYLLYKTTKSSSA
jgi:membrane protease YdiL (CAAX protease family)